MNLPGHPGGLARKEVYTGWDGCHSPSPSGQGRGLSAVHTAGL